MILAFTFTSSILTEGLGVFRNWSTLVKNHFHWFLSQVIDCKCQHFYLFYNLLSCRHIFARSIFFIQFNFSLTIVDQSNDGTLKRAKRYRNKWLLLVTLIHNPQLQGCRKHVIAPPVLRFVNDVDISVEMPNFEEKM